MKFLNLSQEQWELLAKFNEFWFALFSIASVLSATLASNAMLIVENVVLAGVFGLLLRYSKFSYTIATNGTSNDE